MAGEAHSQYALNSSPLAMAKSSNTTLPSADGEVDRLAERRVLWKVDLLLMPIMTISYGLQFYDKFVFSSAAVFGMLADLDLTTPVPGTNQVSTARYSTAGVINYAIGHAHGSLSPWKYMYLVAGSATILWSVLVLAILPDSPATSHRWFNEAERAILTRRMHGNLAGADIWLMAAMGAAIYVCNGGVTAFGSLIIKSFGYSSLRAILLQTPGGATTCISIYIAGYLAGRYKNTRLILLALSCLPVMVGAIILWRGSWHERGLALFGYYLIPIFGAPYVLLLAVASSNVAGGTKKACATGAIFIGYNVGNIIGPYLVDVKQAPLKYRTTWISTIVVMVFTIVSALLLRLILARENARRDKDALASPPTPTEGSSEKIHDVMGTRIKSFEGIMHVDRDLTDWEDRSFRYSL
ncbi:hypothetical protein EW026_g5177 [Hermanssonia centrifuga]|uniref:Uncharacterized protein n=1 Tax=Hermanssonia centrifuga TaxID=98765 RepID=A0A4S4KEX3_9APHY|nr:hypothetical protein EW026_g5177 [Hermanssonia centrifuga]